MLSLIVAISQNNAIGKNGDLLCHLSGDLKHFKSITTGHTILMGSKTYLSLPHRPLPNRRNIVISTQPHSVFEGAEQAFGIEEALAMVKNEEEAFVIGGGSIYQQFLPYADKLYITHIHHSWEDADTFFPDIDPLIWTPVSHEDYPADEKNEFPYSFVEYVRR